MVRKATDCEWIPLGTLGMDTFFVWCEMCNGNFYTHHKESLGVSMSSVLGHLQILFSQLKLQDCRNASHPPPPRPPAHNKIGKFNQFKLYRFLLNTVCRIPPVTQGLFNMQRFLYFSSSFFSREKVTLD